MQSSSYIYWQVNRNYSSMSLRTRLVASYTCFFETLGNQAHFFALVTATCIHLWNNFSATVKHRCNCESRSSVTCCHVRNNRNGRIRVQFEELSKKGSSTYKESASTWFWFALLFLCFACVIAHRLEILGQRVHYMRDDLRRSVCRSKTCSFFGLGGHFSELLQWVGFIIS